MTNTQDADYSVRISIRNGPLRRAIKQTGMTHAQICSAAGISQPTLHEFLALKTPPINAKGELRPSAQKLCIFLNLPIERLFPAQHLITPLKRNTAELDMSLEDVANLIGEADGGKDRMLTSMMLRKALTYLKPRDRMVVEGVYGLNGDAPATYRDLGKEMGISSARVNSLHDRGLRDLRDALKREIRYTDRAEGRKPQAA